MKTRFLLIASLVCLINPLTFSQKPSIIPIKGHNGIVLSLAVSDDNSIVASGGDDSQIRLWSLNTGKLLKTYKYHTYYVKSLAFSPDSKTLFSGSSDDRAIFYSIDSEKVEKKIPIHNPTISYSPDGKFYSIISNLKVRIYRKSDNQEVFYSEGDYISFAPDSKSFFIIDFGYHALEYSLSTFEQIREAKLNLSLPDNIYPRIREIDISKDRKHLLARVQLLYPDYNDRYIGTLCTNEGYEELRISNEEYKDIKLKFSPNGKYVVSVFDWEPIKLYNTETGKELYSWDANAYAASMAYTPDESYLIAGYSNGAIKKFSLKTGAEEKDVCPPKNEVHMIDVSPDGRYLLAQEGNSVLLWSLETANPVKVFKGHEDYIEGIAFLNDNKSFVTASADSTLKLWSLDNEKALKTFRHQDLIYDFSLSPDNKYLISGSKDHTAKLWSVEDGQKLASFETGENYAKHTAFSQDGNYFAYDEIERIVVRSMKNYKLVDTLHIPDKILTNDVEKYWFGITSLAFTPDSKLLLVGSEGQGIQSWNFLKGKDPIKFVDANWTANIVFSHNGQVFAQGPSAAGYVKIRDAKTGEEQNIIRFNDQYITTIKFSTDDRYLFLTFGTNAVKMYDLETNNWIDFLSSGSGDWVVFTNDGYWDGSGNSGSLVNMVNNLNSWNIDQFAIQNNRPDIILQRLPMGDKAFVSYLVTQYKKRLKRAGIQGEPGNEEYVVPDAKITNFSVSGNRARIVCHFSDKANRLTQYNIYVNDVPVYGAKGKAISGNTADINETLELSNGENKIEVSCINSIGAESFRETRYAQGLEKPGPNLYVLSFGVSKYQNATYNLQYADKDASDLAKTMENLKGKSFANVFTKVLTNEQVTPDAIKASKDFVKTARPEDCFVLFIAGHGLHDKDAEATYYYLTSNADLNNLKATAADFESIEELLQGIPPRNKLFLMDACESGEIDDEEIIPEFNKTIEAMGMASRGFKTAQNSVITPKNDANTNIKRSYLLQKDRYIYNDLMRRSGAIVFSSSRGGELSYERNDVQNGLFTEYIMKALSSSEADKDGNGIVSTDELRTYVSVQVAKASSDLQHPTVDRDNIYNKFGFPIR